MRLHSYAVPYTAYTNRTAKQSVSFGGAAAPTLITSQVGDPERLLRELHAATHPNAIPQLVQEGKPVVDPPEDQVVQFRTRFTPAEGSKPATFVIECQDSLHGGFKSTSIALHGAVPSQVSLEETHRLRLIGLLRPMKDPYKKDHPPLFPYLIELLQSAH